MARTYRLRIKTGDIVELTDPTMPRLTVKHIRPDGSITGSYNGHQFVIPRNTIAAVVGHYC